MKKKVFRKSIISIALSLLMLANLLPQFSAVAAENTNNLNLYAGDMIRQGSSQFNGGNIADANCTEFDTNNGVLLLKAGNISSASFKGKYKSYSYNFNLTPSWGTGLTSQWGFAMYFMDTDGVSAHWTHGNNSRYMIYATASNKIQLARFNGSQVASWLTGEIVIPDMNNKDLQCLLACIDENGSTKVSLSINDVKYIDYVDSSAQRLTEAGYITMLNNGSGAGLSLKISGNNPNNIPTYSPTAKKIDAGDLIRTGAANFSGNNIADGNKVSFNAANGNLTLKSGDISSVSNKNAYKNFDYNFKMNPSWGNGLESSQWGFAMYFMDTDGVSAHWAHGSNSRYMIIANSSTNLQLARFNGSQDASWLTGNIPVPDMNNKMLTCRLNCFDENGITRIILTINGTEYINYSDNTTQRLTTAGYITFLNHGSGAGLSLTIGGCTLGTTSSYVGDSLTLNASDMITQGNTQFNGMNIGNTNSVAFDTNKGNMVLRTGTINSASYKQTYSNFNYNFTLNPRWGSGLESKWGFAMFFMDTDGVNAQWEHGSNSRYMLIFNDSTDVQLARYNGSQVAAWLTENNKIPNISNQLLQYQLVCREENGATRIVLLIDGITYLDYLDSSSSRLTTPGYITFLNHGAPGPDGADVTLKVGGVNAPIASSFENVNFGNWFNNSGLINWQGLGVGDSNQVSITSDKKLQLNSNGIHSASFKNQYQNFDITFNINAKWNAGQENEWGWYIFFRDTSGVIANWDSSISKSRYFIYAKNSGEIQLGKRVNSVDSWFAGDPVNVDLNNKDLKCRLKVVNLDAGVSIEFYVNGVKVISKIDAPTSTNPITDQPITSAGYITFLNHNLTGNPLKIDFEQHPVDFKSWTASGTIIKGFALNTEVASFMDGIDVAGNASVKVLNKNLVDMTASDYTGSTTLGTGNAVQVYINGALYSENNIVILGDVTGDGSISVPDLALLKQHLLNTDTLKDSYFLAGDVFSNGSISISDLLAVKKHLLNLAAIVQS